MATKTLRHKEKNLASLRLRGNKKKKKIATKARRHKEENTLASLRLRGNKKMKNKIATKARRHKEE